VTASLPARSPNPVDKALVRAAFSRGAAAYDARAGVQRRVRDRVLRLVADATPGARRVLDVGAGTGALLARLGADHRTGVDLAPGMCAAARAACPAAGIAVADAEALPFASGAFDLFVSTSTFQWLPRLEPALAEARRVLAPGGTLVLALFGERTLHELRGAWRAAGGGNRTHRFPALDELERALASAGLAPHALEEEDVVERHPDARAVLRSLKAIGATNAAPGSRGLGGRRETLEMLRQYDARHAAPEGVPATYHVLYAVADRR
jgi:malonyl-CoA O-methyltransferase